MNLRILIVAGLLAAYGCGSTASGPSTASQSTNPSTGGGGTGTPVSIVNGATVLASSAYAPNPVTIAVGGSVTWTNNDSVTHTSTANNGAFSSGAIAPGGQYTTTFNTAGSYAYHCTIHPGMVGTVTVQ